MNVYMLTMICVHPYDKVRVDNPLAKGRFS